MIYLYKDGEFIEFNYAFDNGLISASQANKIVTRHRFYDKNLDAWWAEEKSKLTDWPIGGRKIKIKGSREEEWSALEDISNGKIPEITEGLDLSS